MPFARLWMALIFTDFQQCTWLLKNLLISQPSQGTMENFQRSSAPPIIKYNCVVLFLCQVYLVINYASKYFLIDHHDKRCVIIYWSSHKWQNLVIFPQRAPIKMWNLVNKFAIGYLGLLGTRYPVILKINEHNYLLPWFSAINIDETRIVILILQNCIPIHLYKLIRLFNFKICHILWTNGTSQ